MSIRIRTVIIIILTNLVIILFSVLAGIRFVGNNILRSQEEDLSMVANIADHFISSEIELLKLAALSSAQRLGVHDKADWPMVVDYQLQQHRAFSGMTVMDQGGNLLITAGELPAQAEVLELPNIQGAFLGRMGFSTTQPSPVGMVFYLAAPLGDEENHILVLTLPGIHFNERISGIVIWQTGHIFMADAEGVIIANLRESWVQTRINFFALAEGDSVYSEVAAVLARVVQGETGVGYFSMEGVPRLCSFRPVSASEDGWGLGIIAPLPESPFRNIDRGLVVVGLVGVLLSIFAALIASTFVKKPFTEIAALKENAERNSMYKSIFLADMSHEMRTPMNAIIGMTSIGKSSSEIDKKDYAFEKIEDASSHLLGVINDVLDMSKIEANKLELSLVTYNFETMIQKAVNVITFRIDERDQRFSVHIDTAIPHFLVGDDHRLAQVITNLLSNAAKFTPEQGSIRLSASHLGEADGTHTIQIEVQDTGIGISLEQQEHLFAAFQQAESGTSRKFGGTGLGLAISKRIVELMGGRIWVDSDLGSGATFAFTFQAQAGEGKNESLLAPEVNISTIRILVIDDDQDILYYFKDIMERNNIRCDLAPGSNEALSLIEKHGLYDLYFIDWNMPGMNGIELSKIIKDKGSSDRSPRKSVVIMISAAQWDQIEAEAKAAGVDKFLPKPLFPSLIINAINECLGANSLKKISDDAKDKPLENFEGRVLLLAEDVEINREIVITLLEPTGIQIECAENGREAVEKFQAEPYKFDIILMDIHMPEVDGYEATQQIRKIEEELRGPGLPSKGVPILAMTANVFKEDIEKCLALGMNDHLGKPLDIGDVLSKMRHYLPEEN
ncbi:MAG: response regulator [Treponema sp.]|nr:response regulator [Treponema sp.]